MIALTTLLLSGAHAQPQYAWPTTHGAYVSAHFDHAGAGLLDWRCGTRTYDGHKGTDIAGLARNTPVYAGADGVVIRRYDGFGDGYWGDWSGGGFGNHVALYHGNGNTTIYGHLTAYSGLPAMDAEVDCLDPLGGIGTSGNSTGLHLHFETRLNTDGAYYYTGYADDPYAGTCSGAVSYWTDQSYDAPTQECADGTVIPPDFCDGKQNGDWCDGDDLVTCQSGDVQSRHTCSAGCQSMPLGTPDACATTEAEFCDGLMDGAWCDGDDLITCSGGHETRRSACPAGCTSMPLGTPDACAATETDFCAGRQDGMWCDGDDLVECSADVSVNRDACSEGCRSMPPGTPDECHPEVTGFCVGKQDGLWCDGDDLVDCEADQVYSRSECTEGCVSMPLGTPDQCASDDSCVGLMNGDWCDGSDLITCSNDQVVDRRACALGCESMPLGTPDRCY